MPIVKMPDGQMVEMPDKPTPEQVAALQQVMGKASAPAPEVPGGVAGAADQLAFAAQGQAAAKGVSLPQEALAVADTTLRGGALFAPKAVMDITEAKRQQGKALPKDASVPQLLNTLPPPQMMPLQLGWNMLPESVRKAMQEGFTPTKPQTELGQQIGNVGASTLASMIVPGAGSLGTKAAIGASSGVGAEVGAKLGGDDALSRIIGALAGGAVPTAISKVTPNATKLIREATSEVPDTAFRRAESIKRTLDENNIPALSSQLLGPRSSLDDVVADAAANPKVRPRVLARVERIPERAEQALTNWKAQALPVNATTTRETLGDVQEVAARKIAGLEQGGANAAYTAALPAGTSASTYTPKQVKALAEQFRTLSRDPNYYGPATGGGRFLNTIASRIEKSLEKSKLVDARGNPIETAVPKGYVNNLLKDLNTVAEKTGYKGKGLADAKALLKGGTPEFDPARAAKAAFMETKVNPVKKGLAGELAEMGGGVRPDKFTAKATAIDRVFPKNVAQPPEIRQLIKDIGVDDVAALYREQMARTMHATFKSASAPAGTNQPAKFVDEMLGTRAQRQNTAALLEVMSKQAGADPRFVKHGFYKLMRALQTTRDIKIPNSVDRVALQQKAGENLPGYVVALMSRVSRSLWNRMSEKTYGKIADIVLAPDGLKQIEKIAKSPSPAYATAYAVSVLEQALAEEEAEGIQQEQQ